MAAQAEAESLIPRYNMRLQRCELQQGFGYLMSLIHAMSVLSWP
jgi:hypothetical protein